MGSRGDVEPMVALAAGLAVRGVRARVVGLADYAALAAQHGVDYVPVDASIDEALARAQGRLGRHVMATPVGQALALRGWMRDLVEPFTAALLEAVEPGEQVLSGVLTRDVATALAEARGCRPVTVVYTGQVPTMRQQSNYFGHLLGPWERWNAWGNRTSWVVSTSLGRDVGRHVRTALGLPQPGIVEAVRRADLHPTVVAASPVLVPPADDWPTGTHQTGQLVLPESSYEPDAVLAEFLAAGPAPVYVGFGSMTKVNGDEARAVVLGAAERSGGRVLTPADPGSDTHLLAEGVLAVEHVPHHWLLPRTAGVVHHGGAGTTGTALRAGVPSVAVPFGADQPYHARRLHALGVGPAPVGIRRLTPGRLARLLHDLVDGPGAAGYRSRAADLGRRCRAEDGVGDTVDFLLARPHA